MLRTDLYFGFRWQLTHRGMRSRRFQALTRLNHIMMERLCRTMPFQWLPAAYLAHLETRTFPDRLASVRDGWDETRQIPILLYDHPDGYQLWNGNHRLTAARAIGAEAVKAVILPFNGPYTAAVNRERAEWEEIWWHDHPFAAAAGLSFTQTQSGGRSAVPAGGIA